MAVTEQSSQHPAPPLSCTVRACGSPLARSDTSWRCGHGHSFDVARSGYLNLLQPQDRRSRHPGDPVAAGRARSRLLSQGVGVALLAHIASTIGMPSLETSGVIVDVGCGGGELLGSLSHSPTQSLIGIDLSADAVTRASRAWPTLTWVVANADIRLPVLDASADIVVSIHARRNPLECARVLRPGGRLVIAVPAPDDLAELRESLYGARRDRHRAERVVVEHAPHFALDDRVEHRERLWLEPGQLRDMLAGTYRGAREASTPRLEALSAMTVTLASTVLQFSRL